MGHYYLLGWMANEITVQSGLKLWCKINQKWSASVLPSVITRRPYGGV